MFGPATNRCTLGLVTSEHWRPDLYKITQSANKLPHANVTKMEESGHTGRVISK